MKGPSVRGQDLRNKRKLKHHAKEFLWPSMGWKRYWSYLWTRVKRISLKSSIHSVAAGMSLGYVVSFNPMIGTHTFWLLGMCWLFRANFIVSMITSLIGNIWTFPFFLWLSYQVGSLFLPFLELSQGQSHTIKEFSNPGAGEVFLTTFMGWPIIGSVIFILSYYPHRFLVKAIKKAYQERKKRKIHNE